MSSTVAATHAVIFGRPGCGKSSLAERLGADYGYSLVRTGELLRAAVRRGDDLGRRVEGLLKSGNLAPDELIFELLDGRLKNHHEEKLLFDGFPRTMGQVPQLKQLENHHHFTIDTYLDVSVSHDAAVARMTGRRICPSCGATYHLLAKPPVSTGICDIDGAKLEQRRDDSPAVIEQRQRVYEQHAGPILAHYQTTYPTLFKIVNGEQSVHDVYLETKQVLGLSFSL